MNAPNLSPSLSPKDYETILWDFWMKEGFFHAEVDEKKKPFTIIIPPPNVTSNLHMGHGLNVTIQDILIRYHRMRGFNAMWLPGTDHAGISTQMMVEKSLGDQGLTRKGLGREAFFAKCVEWRDKYGAIIISQQKKLGASCDWEREAYTLDQNLSAAVRTIFVKLFKDGLIYRGERLIHWDTTLETAISDDEVENCEVSSEIYYIRYPIQGIKDAHLVVATTRPETMFGDTAVGVHPDDERYQHLIGKNALLPFTQKAIPIVADSMVKMDFGTGCVKITPAHDHNDFQFGKRHKLPFVNMMNPDGTLNEVCPPPFKGMDRQKARTLLITKLKEIELFEKSESIKHSVPFSERSKVPIEPRLSKQWFVSMKPLAEAAIASAKSGEFVFLPELWRKTYLHWLENIEDWCISRQLWWGHRIPIWTCNSCQKQDAYELDPKHCSFCKSEDIHQDEDVLDTWFSSWLWPLSPLGWPKETKDLSYFFPSSVLVTAPDIIFLWVARMVMVSYYVKGALAFKAVYFNSLICDKKGRKFSKTLGNGIDPIEMIDLYGADSVRFTCIHLASLGGRVRMDKQDFETGHRFVTKIWNAARFLFSKLENFPQLFSAMVFFDESKLDLPSKWLIHQFDATTLKMNQLLSSYQTNEAAELLYQFIWDTFCDWGIESTKESLANNSNNEKILTLSCVFYVFEGLLRLASPFIPFISEEIWQKTPHHPFWPREKSLMVCEYPESPKDPRFSQEARNWEFVQNVVSGIRSARSQAGLSFQEKTNAFISCSEEQALIVLECKAWIQRLSSTNELYCGPNVNPPSKTLLATGKGFKAYVEVGDKIDFDKEKNRLRVEKERLQGIHTGLLAKLSNQDFLGRAPKDVVEKTQAQNENISKQIDDIDEQLKSFGF